MSRQFDPDAIASLAKKVAGLTDGYSKASQELGDGDPGTAFGHLSNAASAGSTVKAFHSNVNKELDAANELVQAAADALASAAERLRDDDGETAHSFGGSKRE
ncbi:hypothetical protein [Thermocrispum sp.]|jgi:uncharacterized protein YukE|uniref:ESX-1 secretion-associated protein n=1 Tax=Thermocrispum agreste TaxID=37925 RepID=A0A2W4JQJ5_9PSEU|nr:hypothetical protein [Thermocrispum sp.]PZN01251.1 MAG: hypothetical protein DIU77_01270 [Thermocrispum agreste]